MIKPLATLLAALALLPAVALAAPPSLLPFVIPWDDSSRTATDLSYLNAKPAGVNGQIVARGGHCIESKTGDRVRFVGVNFTFNADFPAHADAERIAAHLAKMGVNIVRIHHLDMNSTQLWDKQAPGHQAFDPVALDKLDYLIAQLKKNGIYVDINLHVSRTFVPEDGFPASVAQIPGDFDKRVDNYDRTMIALQKKYARDLLEHVNPYTGMSYAFDPCVAVVEINNENSLVSWGDRIRFFDELPEPFRSELVGMWDDWLAKRYGSDAAMRSAWINSSSKTASAGIGPIMTSATKWAIEDKTQVASLKPSVDTGVGMVPGVEIVSPNLPAEDWNVQAKIEPLNLVEGVTYVLTFRAKADKARVMPVYASLTGPDWHHVGLDDKASLSTDWKPFRYTFAASDVVPGQSRMVFVVGGDTGTVDIADVTIAVLTSATVLPQGQSLAQRSVDIPTAGGPAEVADWTRFLSDTERAYADEMRGYLRDTLRVKANIIDTQMSYGGLSSFSREAGSDYADGHAYWQHPQFPGKPWDPVDWTIQDTPMVDVMGAGDGSTLAGLAFDRYAGKPYSISEYNEPAPSDYQAEMLPMYASFAALQDWDMIYAFDYGDYGVGQPRDKIQGFFAIQGNPAKEGFLPAAALIFRRGEIAPLQSVTTMHLAADLPGKAGTPESAWRQTGRDTPPDFLSTRFQVAYSPTSRITTVATTAQQTLKASEASIVKMSSGNVYTAQGNDALTLAGYIGGQQLEMGSTHFTFPTFGDNFAGLALTSEDGLTLSNSHRLLLTITGKVENTGMVWNAAHNSVGNQWGHGPVQAEGIPATVTLADSQVKHVWALDPAGARLTEVPVNVSGGKATFTVGPQYQTIWYEIGD